MRGGREGYQGRAVAGKKGRFRGDALRQGRGESGEGVSPGGEVVGQAAIGGVRELVAQS